MDIQAKWEKIFAKAIQEVFPGQNVTVIVGPSKRRADYQCISHENS